MFVMGGATLWRVWNAALIPLVAVALWSLPVASAPADRCGVWRWDVKTLSDSDAPQVNFAPSAETISQLRTLDEPGELKSRTPRIDPVEFQVYRVRGRLLEYKREQDRDFHVVVAQPDQPTRTMVVEGVDPTCPGARDSVRVGAMQAVRQEFTALYGQPTTGFKQVPGQPTAFAVGVGFWDSCRGAHIPRGAAPNCIELHPVLAVEPIP